MPTGSKEGTDAPARGAVLCVFLADFFSATCPAMGDAANIVSEFLRDAPAGEFMEVVTGTQIILTLVAQRIFVLPVLFSQFFRFCD